MKDDQFWDSYLSSMEDLQEDPPPGVKEQVFQRMDRYYRRQRRWKRGGIGFLMACLLGGAAFFFIETDGEQKELAGAHVEIPRYARPVGSELNVVRKKGDDDRKMDASSSSTEDHEGGSEGVKEASSVQKDGEKGAHSRAAPSSDRKVASSAPKKENVDADRPSAERDAKKLAVAGQEEKGSTERDAAPSESGESGTSTKGAGDTEDVRKKGGEDELERMPQRLPETNSVSPGQVKAEGLRDIPAGKDSDPLSTPRFFVGSDLAFNFTRLMDRRTLESFEASSLVSTDADLYFDYGITAGVKLGRRTELVGRYFMKKDVGQRYAHYVDGRYRTEGIQLSYRNYELLLEHDLAQGYLKAKHRTYFSVYGGGHFAQLRGAERKEEGRIRSVMDAYKEHSFGLEGGFRMGIETKPGLDVGLLLGTSYSLTSIRKADPDNMLPERDAHNLSIGGGLSLRYYFGPDL